MMVKVTVAVVVSVSAVVRAGVMKMIGLITRRIA
jgi:hypothetical protein